MNMTKDDGGVCQKTILMSRMIGNSSRLTQELNRRMTQTAGLVVKKSLPSDRRIYSVALTDEGRDKLKKAEEKHGVWIRELLACVDGGEVDFMNSFLDKMDRQAKHFSED